MPAKHTASRARPDKQASDSASNGHQKLHRKTVLASRQADHFALIKDIRSTSPIKHNDVFLIVSDSSDILGGEEAQGLYFHDTRHLDTFELRLNGTFPMSLLADASAGTSATYELTNVDLDLADGRTLRKEMLSVRRVYQVEHSTITHTLTLTNRDQQEVALDLTLSFGTQFTNMFVIRGNPPGKRGTVRTPDVHGNRLVLAYDGADKHVRTTTLTFTPKPATLDETQARYTLRLKPRDALTLTVTMEVADDGPDDIEAPKNGASQRDAHSNESHKALVDSLRNRPHVETDNPLFDRALARAFLDLEMLATSEHGDVYISAGVPWYAALFGRDSLITAFEVLAYQPHLARTTLQVLARYQGDRFDDFQDEEPGKILHELRLGEKANLHEIPQFPYYGTVDATPWFLLLLGEYVRWTGDLGLFDELRDCVDHALNWIDNNPRWHSTEFLAYGSRSEHGLVNHGWKDAYNAIVTTDGALANPPIQLVEVQGYVFRARRAVAELFRLRGDEERARDLERQADDLRERFEHTFWMRDSDFYAMGLEWTDESATQIQSIGSNPGQALFGGIVSERRARSVARRLMRDDMFCGWGIRTLSSREVAYNPLDYQTGSVWPHDNALIACGLWDYGLVDDALRVFEGIFSAAVLFKHYRLPEVFDGFDKTDSGHPVHYPVACSPQAWAAGTLPLLLQTVLGLRPDAPHNLLRIVHPSLPPSLNEVTIHGLRVGAARIDLRYQRSGDNTLVAVLNRTQDIRVTVEQ